MMTMRVYALYEGRIWVLILCIVPAVCTMGTAIVSLPRLAECLIDMAGYSGQLLVAQETKNPL